MQPLGAMYIQGVTRVADLLSPNGTAWNQNRLDEMFSPEDVADIKQIAIGGPGTEDFLAWNYTKKWCVHCALGVPPQDGCEQTAIRTAGVVQFSQ